MTQFVVAHKVALIIVGALIGGFVLYSRRAHTAAATGIPVDPYASTEAADGGGFDLGSLLTPGPAGAVTEQSEPGTPLGADAPDAVVNTVTNSSTDSTPTTTISAVPYTPAAPTVGTSVAAGTVTSSGQIATGSDGPLRGVGTPTRGGLPGVLV